MLIANKKLFVGSIVFAICFIVSACYQVLILQKLDTVSSLARPAVREVLKSQYLSYVTGSYWENEMLKQAKIVSKLPQHARADFFRAIVLFCELDTSSSFLGSSAESVEIFRFWQLAKLMT